MRHPAAVVPVVLLLLLTGCRASAPIGPPAGVPVLTRAEWGAAAPVLPMQRHLPRQITIHHTAVRQAPARGTAEKLRALQRFSQERSTLGDGRIKEPWADVPYHFYIGADGTIAEARPLGFVGDSNTPYDLRGQIQIVLEGNFEEESPTGAQYDALWRLTWALAREWRVAPEQVHGHRDHTATLCPGGVLYEWLPLLRRHLAEHL
jgi:N-acetyl-anhydromuramyl-L-alanine amidase AmpD